MIQAMLARSRGLALVALSSSLLACAQVQFAGTENRLQIAPREVLSLGKPVPTGTVVWGGQILQVENLENGSEMLVLALPLSRGNVPRIEQESIGRFVVAHPGYLEPLDYTPGRYVTLAGTLEGMTDRWQYEDSPFELPLVRSGQVHLWPRDTSRWQTLISFGFVIGIHN